MKSFKEYITESTNFKNATLEDLQGYVDACLKAKYITNPDYKALLEEISYRHLNLDGKKDYDAYYKVLYTQEYKDMVVGNDDKIRIKLDVLYPFCNREPTINDVIQLKKKIETAKKYWPVNQPMIVRGEVFYNKYIKLAEAVKELKQYIVKTTTIRAAVKDVKEKERVIAFTDARTLVDVLNTYKETYKKRAEEEATKHIDYLLDELKKANWDLDVIAPLPDSIKRFSSWGTDSAKRNLFTSITDQATSSVSFKYSGIRKKSASKRTKYINNAIANAAESYDNYVGKMVVKIGKPVVSATFTGDPWHGSLLTVVTSDGGKQVWNTKMILNYSKYGAMFNQFPSRLKK